VGTVRSTQQSAISEQKTENIKQRKSSEKSFSWLQILPFFVIVGYIVAIFLIKGRLPTPEDLINTIREWYMLYGNYLVFIAALLEATFLLGLYVPGSTVILFGAALSKSGAIGLPGVLILADVGLILGYTLNYFLGKYGWYHVLSKFGLEGGIQEAKEKIHKYGKGAFFVGYIFPNSGAFLSTAAGVMKVPFWQFFLYSVLSQTFWIVVWGSVAYFLGSFFVDLFMKYFGYMILGIFGIYFVKKYFFSK
jgi:membrane protein DedA with SNARE-associated domain